MKLIHKFKSPNYDYRKSKSIKFIIIHYTALGSLEEAIKHLCLKNNKVSSHYLISQKGEVYNLVSDAKRAWHAGLSFWQGKSDINSLSIGIELDYSPSGLNNKFSNKLKTNLCLLLQYLVKKYQIVPENILGHSDIAPYRKIDPGKQFPWYLLENKKITSNPKIKKNSKLLIKKLRLWFLKNKFYSKKNRILFMLNSIGYDIFPAFKNSKKYSQLINAYSLRNRIYKNYYYNKKNIEKVVEFHFLNMLLTKFKK